MKKVMMIGKTQAGKTSLCQILNNEKMQYCKTQSMEIIGGRLLDTPGEYLERPGMKGALNVTAADVDLIFFVQSAVDQSSMFPPGYAGSFMKPCIGIVTKADLASEEQIKRAGELLLMAGVKKLIVTSSEEKTGFEELFEMLQES
ncbi:MAG: EutP/PduV family microcompartment system protein [Ruminococcus sp.]|jgi:ethanolamine utilization protein EutP